MPELIIIAAVGGIALVAVFVLALGLRQVLVTASPEVSQRLDQYTATRNAAIAAAREAKAEPKAKRQSALRDGMDRLLADRSFGQKMARDLARADLRFTPAEWLTVWAISAIFCTAVTFLVSGGNFVLALVGLIVGAVLPRFYVRRRQKKRVKNFNNQLGDTIALLANALRSGYSLLQAMDAVGRDAPSPTSDEFRRVVREVGLGLSPQEALDNMLDRVPSEDLDLMVVAIGVQHEVGGNLSTILENIAYTIRERVRIKGEIKSLTAMQQYSGYALIGIPIAMTGILFLINSSFMLPMFKVPYVAMPITGGIMLSIGFVIIKKITDIKV